MVIKEGRSRSKYFFADSNCIVTPPEKTLTLPSEDVTFDLSTDQLDKLLKAAAIYQLSDLSVVGGDGVVKVLVRDKKNETSNDFSIIVGETDATFSFNFKVENIKILPGNYDVVVSQKLLSRFTSKNQDLTYYIALEPDSTFEWWLDYGGYGSMHWVVSLTKRLDATTTTLFWYVLLYSFLISSLTVLLLAE